MPTRGLSDSILTSQKYGSTWEACTNRATIKFPTPLMHMLELLNWIPTILTFNSDSLYSEMQKQEASKFLLLLCLKMFILLLMQTMLVWAQAPLQHWEVDQPQAQLQVTMAKAHPLTSMRLVKEVVEIWPDLLLFDQVNHLQVVAFETALLLLSPTLMKRDPKVQLLTLLWLQ